MTHHPWRGLATAFLVALALAAIPASAEAQYFGRNKVQYEDFDFRILRSERFDFYYYPAESLATSDMARAGDRWYARLSDLFRHTFDRKSVVLYADHPDFQQTNVVGSSISEGTGGITESMRTRVVMPHTGSYWDTDHVLGHEIVHVFQYNIAESGPGGINSLGALPLWLIEGMAEYLSIGRQHGLTAMWLRDAVMRDDLPTIKKLNTDPKYFPYRYGQALWAYIGGRYGDRAVIDVFRASLRLGWDPAIRRVLGVNSDTLSKEWIASIKSQYQPYIAGRANPDSVGRNVLQVGRRGGDYNVSPIVSPDGRHVAFYSSRDLFGIDLYLADAQTGRIIKKLAAPSTGRHLDAISFIQSAGDFSPDGTQFAFIAFANGDHEIQVLDVGTASVTRRVQVPNVGAMNSLAWSPDGRTIAFSGMVGGISDIYLFDVQAGTVRQVTNDRFADLHPAWSPDGRTVAFSSDRGPRTNFETMTYGRMQLATVDVASGEVNVYSPFANARHINPQYAPNGQDLLFVADPDGISNIFRLNVASGAVAQVTNVATGISGITDLSPAISIAENTGRLVFNVFDNQGHALVSLEAQQTAGTPVSDPGTVAAASVLPPGDTPGRAPITTYLADALSGLPQASQFEQLPYKPKFSLDAIGQPSLGVSAGGPFGTGISGGVSAYFGDQLGDQLIGTSVQAQGQLKDIGGQLFYLNMKRRFNWGGSISHVPYLSLGAGVSESDLCGDCVNYDLFMQRLFYSEAAAIGQYPFSTTRRAEFQVAATRIGYDLQIQRTVLRQVGGGYQAVANPEIISLDSLAPDGAYTARASAAYVGDWSNSAFTSPIQGGRYRFEVTPTIGTRSFTSALADYRRYHFVRPVSFAWRAMHYGNYGKDSEDWNYNEGGLSYPLFLGEPSLVRGYAYNSFDNEECTGSDPVNGGCPVVARLIGSRLAVFNAELRIPLVGSREFGLINLPFLPVEMSPFFDAGIMWTSDQAPRLQETDDPLVCTAETAQVGACAQRIPVFSAGLSFRVNILGYAVLETYIAHPFQRPQKNWVYGFHLAPGW